MNEVLLVALFSSAGAALVAVAGAAASIFGPAWREKAQRDSEREYAASNERYARALDLVEALGQLTVVNKYADIRHAQDARNRFVATLRAGEGAVGGYTARLLANVENQKREGLLTLNAASDLLFGWLRGDVPIEAFDLQMPLVEVATDRDSSDGLRPNG